MKPINPDKCKFCGEETSPGCFETQDGDMVCPDCETSLCEWCESRLVEYEIGNSLVCQCCYASRIDADYDAWKESKNDCA